MMKDLKWFDKLTGIVFVSSLVGFIFIGMKMIGGIPACQP